MKKKMLLFFLPGIVFSRRMIIISLFLFSSMISFSQNSHTQEPDDTYGPNGFKETTTKVIKLSLVSIYPDTAVDINWIDSAGRRRKNIHISLHSNSKSKESSTVLYDSAGRTTYDCFEQYDSTGKKYGYSQMLWQDGKMVSEYSWHITGGMLYQDVNNPATKRMEHLPPVPYNPENFDLDLNSTGVPLSNSEHIIESKVAMTDNSGSGLPKFQIEAGVGYCLPFNGGLLGQNVTFSGTTYSASGVYGSWGTGVNFYVRPEFKVCHSTTAGVQFDYISGKQYTWSTNSTGSVTSLTENYKGNYYGVSVSPFVNFYPCHFGEVTPFVGLGLPMNVSSMIKQTEDGMQTVNGTTTHTIQTSTLKGSFTIGFNAEVGVRYRLSDHWNLCGGLNFHNSSFVPSTWKVDSYMVNGSDKLSTLNPFQKQTNYVKSYTSAGSLTDPNSPMQTLKYSAPESYFGPRIGVSYSF
ncbi:MAG TPA: hypothetical protein VGG71_02665 [Chitinophagaceae bacterium]